MDYLPSITHQLEYLFLKKIIEGLKNRSISLPQAKEYATKFLAIEPFSSIEDAYKKISDFVENKEPFIELKTYIGSFEKEKDVAGKISKMSELIKQNNIDAALNVARE